MSVRVERVAAKIKFEVARIIQSEMNDPRMGFITVTGVDLSPDFRHAKVHVSVLADKDGEVRRVMKMLEDATGFIQSKVAGRLQTRTTPFLRFLLDEGAKKSVEISSLLDELKKEREEREAAQAAESGEGEAGEPDADAEADADAESETEPQP